MRNLISVIVPVYNVEAYLRKALDSIIKQTYDNLEILIIFCDSNDGSRDICDEYARKDSRIIIVGPVKKGVGNARNIGLDVCTGDYIAFVDSDDWIEPELFERLLQAMEEGGSEIAICGFRHIDESGRVLRSIKPPKSTVGAQETLEVYFGRSGIIYPSVWAKMYKSQLFKNIRFPDYITSEDKAIMHRLLGMSTKNVMIEDCLYNYLIRPGSLDRSPVTVEHINATITIAKDFIEYARADFPDLSGYARGFACTSLFILLGQIIRNKQGKQYKTELTQIRIVLSEFFKRGVGISGISVRERRNIVLAIKNMTLFKLAINIVDIVRKFGS